MSEGSEQDRVIDLSVEVPGTPEEVWEAIATGPGITSWFVPHAVEEHEGGGVRMDFGGGLGEESAVVAAWEPPKRVVLQNKGEPALAFEWLVEARDGGSCVVRLVCTGFGSGENWDDEYHGMSEGWRLFLENLRLHLTHFPGQRARAIIPTQVVPGTVGGAFEELCTALGIPADLAAGDRLEATSAGAPQLAGRVASVGSSARTRSYVLVLDAPAPGTALLIAEPAGDQVALSLWLYLYGPASAGLPDTWSPFLETVVLRTRESAG